MTPAVVSFGLLIGGALLTGAALWRLGPALARILAGFLTGFLIAILNMGLEYLGAELDLYSVSGPWPVLRSPLPLTLAWIFMTFLYCTGYGALVRGRKGARRTWIRAGIALGGLTDLGLFRQARILTLGPQGSPAFILLVWAVFIPLTIFLYEFFLGLLEKRPPAPA